MLPDTCAQCGATFEPTTYGGNRKVYCSRPCLDRASYERQQAEPARNLRRLAYGRWKSMVKRCQDPSNVRWSHYGGRGIYVVERWQDFETYYADVGDPPEGMTLDRIDNDGPYSPENTRWATPAQQRANQAPRATCRWGHPFIEGLVDSRGVRYCRVCRQQREAKRQAAKRQAAKREARNV